VLRLCCKHTFPTPGVEVRRGKDYFGSLTNAVFIGERAPVPTLKGSAKAKDWFRWSLRMAFIHASTMFVLITADTPVRDFHHRYPSFRQWSNYFFTRQADLEAGHSGWPPYTSVWGLGAGNRRGFRLPLGGRSGGVQRR
jgi:hypothetical protein